jgi:pimeloyl-ACP methyl ester carboxylesterase
MTPVIRDHPVMIGARQSLLGILTQAADCEPGHKPAFVILNSGIIHRVGHHRTYVALARLLAAAGHQVLRFDLAGVGDSERRADGLALLDGVVADIREAVDWLAATQGMRRVVIVGLCAGADHALIYGMSDARVCGLVLLDPSIPPTRGYYLRYFARHIMRPGSWAKLAADRSRLRVAISKWLGTAPPTVWAPHRPNLNDPVIRAFLETAYQRSMDLGIACLAVFTSGFPHQHNYRRQIFDAFPTIRFGDRLRLEYFAGSDHVFTAEADRRRLFGLILDWSARIGDADDATAAATAGQKPVAPPAPKAAMSYEL